MASSVNRKTWIRASGSHQLAGGATTVEVSLSVPIRGWIRRVRVAGSGNLTASIGEASSPGTFGVVLAYGATATPIDQEEDPGIFYQVDPTANAGRVGILYIDVVTTVADSLVSLQLDIEPAN